MLFIGGAAWWSAARSAETFRWVDHTHEVLYRMEAALTRLLVLQSSSRGYALSANDDLLRTYDSDEIAARENLRRLRQAVADNPAQLQRLDRLDPLVAHSIDLFRERIALRRSGGLEAVVKTRTNTTGRPTMDLVLASFNEMELAERRLLAERSAAAQAGQEQAVLVFGFGSVVATLLVIAAGLTVRRDFQHRVKVEAALRASEERIRLMVENVRDYAIIMLSPTGQIVSWNAGAAQIKGYAAEEIIGRHFSCFYPEEAIRRGFPDQELTGAARDGRFEDEGWRLRRDGTRLWANVVITAMRDPRGILLGYVKITRDLSERKRQEEHIQQLNADLHQRAAQLEAVNKELEAFSYSVSHDLRAPLRHVDGFANLLHKNSAAALDDQGRRYLTTISDSARQMGRLIDDLLSFSRMGRAALQPCEVEDHDALVASIIRDGRWDRPDRIIAWQVAPLPPVRADRAMLQQVWTNLLDNAVKYSGKVAAPLIEVGTRTDPATGEQVFFVHDNGAGFDMRYVDKLFGVFQRLHGPAEFEGTGIGLANVRRIILRHGGRTWAEGAPGQGATFYFALPAISTPAAA